MDGGQHQSQFSHSTTSSSSSAIDFTGAGLSVPQPPNSDVGRTRRRASWSKVDAEGDPVHLSLPSIEAGPSTLGRSTPTPRELQPGLEDPFYSPIDPEHSIRGPSFVSLLSTTDSDSDAFRDDDQAHLTTKQTLSIRTDNIGWLGDHRIDSEHIGGATPRTRRRTVARFSSTPSPLQRTGTAIKTAWRRASMRVANVRAYDTSIRLPDDDDDTYSDVFPIPNDRKDETEDANDLCGSQKVTLLRGYALGFLGPTNSFRLKLYHVLSHSYSEPIILALILATAIVLVIQASRTILLSPTQSSPSPQKGYFYTWEDYALFVLYILFTVESIARICVSGLILDTGVPTSSLFTIPTFSSAPAGTVSTMNIEEVVSRSDTLSRGLSFKRFYKSFTRPFALPKTTTSTPLMQPPIELSSSRDKKSYTPVAQSQSQPLANSRTRFQTSESTFFSRAFRSDITKSKDEVIALPFRLNVHDAHSKLTRNIPYLRQSWGRIDFIAMVTFWVSFVLATIGVERGVYHIGIFRALSVLRIARLLAITSGTTTIMRSLKVARPLLATVAYFVVFAMVLFSIVGVQSFKGSLRRNCYLLPTLGEGPTQMNTFCGGHVNATTLELSPYLQLDGSPGVGVKGFICPLGQICQEGQNPNSGVESFDAVWNSALQVIVVASANTWSTTMYQIMNAEYFASCLFFIAGILVLNFWLINLFVAVITNTFSAIRSETRKSAFGAAPLGPLVEEREEGWSAVAGRHSNQNGLKIFYSYTRWGWILLTLSSLAVQATTTANMSTLHQDIIYDSELFLAIAFDIEIIIRIAAELPAWRVFFKHGNNWIDLILATGSTVIQIPVIHQSRAYPWLTMFQLGRFYRVILEFPRMKPLLLTVFGNLYALFNMVLFLMLVNFLAALVAIQLIQGDMTNTTTMNFGQLWNSFLAVYQLFSSENWTTVLYNATGAELPLGQAVIVATFLSCWLVFANFIVLQMFIAVINENFHVAEEAKKDKQASDYWARHQQQQATHSRWTYRLNPYHWLKADPVTVRVENLPSNLILPVRESVVQDYSLSGRDRMGSVKRAFSKGGRHTPSKSITVLQRLFTGNTRIDNFLSVDLRQPKSGSMSEKDAVEDHTEQYLEILAGINNDTLSAEALSDALQEQRARRADFIRDHPTYDKTFWVFSQQNRCRRLCQKIVTPAGGERIFGTSPDPVAHTVFQLLIFLTIIGGIITEAIAPPLYRRNWYLQHGVRQSAWFNVAEATFGLALFVEFLIKIIADGLLFTPNAYVRSMWNVIDFVILVGILVNVGLNMVYLAHLNRFIHALKALRALRLITLIDQMRNTFENLIISGVVRILDAALLAILYLIPFSVWGTNIFAGLMNECNDGSVQGISDCTGEYVNTIPGNSFGFLVPRAWNNPSPSTTFSFDNFRASMLILFEIVSFEGWIDVMSVSMSITGPGQQPQTNASEANAIFFVTYNLLGGVVILTLFVSIIIGNFSSKTGSAFLTQPQREWIDLQKLLQRQKPSKRPHSRPSSAFRAWCYDRAVHKHGWWSRTMTFLFVMQIIVLMTETFAPQPTMDQFRDDFSLFLTSVYVLDILVRFYGVGWESFRDNGWNIFDVIVAFNSFTATLIVQVGSSNPTIKQVQKLFLVCIAFKLVQRMDSLNHLFKTATASLPVILNLLGLWLVLFVFFAIMFMEVFGMTKWYSAETSLQNYQSIGNALVMLAFMSTGEGWNQFMHDYATIYPRCTYTTSAFFQTDCGSIAWALSLFIAWNLLSMYIMLNMFTGVVVENFSYVFQSTGGAKSVTRQQMRSFKKIWAEFSDAKTGLLDRQKIAPFLSRLSGVFEARIYPREFSISAILAICQDNSKKAARTGGVNLRKLNNMLNKIDYASIRKRRSVYVRLYHEANVASRRSGSISFTDMLLLLAHHRLIDDREALVLKDLVLRQEMNKLVTDLVNLDRVRSLLKMISLRRRYFAKREDISSQQRDIPTIFVNSSPATPPPLGTRDIVSPHSDHELGQSDYDSPSPTQSPRIRIPSLSTVDRSFRSSLQRARRVSDVSMLSADMSQSYWREHSPELEGECDLISSIQQSMWGEMMLQAAREESDS